MMTARIEEADESPSERGDHESRDQIDAVIALMNSQRDVRQAEQGRGDRDGRDDAAEPGAAQPRAGHKLPE